LGARDQGVRLGGSDVKSGLDEVDEHLVASALLPPMGEVAISDLLVADVARRAGRDREAAGRESTAWLRVAASGATRVTSLFSHVLVCPVGLGSQVPETSPL
jgi:hypothetical protein